MPEPTDKPLKLAPTVLIQACVGGRRNCSDWACAEVLLCYNVTNDAEGLSCCFGEHVGAMADALGVAALAEIFEHPPGVARSLRPARRLGRRASMEGPRRHRALGPALER
jgi:hypothetical protein